MDQVLEETGYDLSSQLRPDDFIEMSIKEQRITLYVVGGVPEDYLFQTRTRKEISVRIRNKFCSFCSLISSSEDRMVFTIRSSHLEAKQTSVGEILSYFTLCTVSVGVVCLLSVV